MCSLLSYGVVARHLGQPEDAVNSSQDDEAPVAPYLVSITEGIYFSVSDGESEVGNGPVSVNILVKRGASAAPPSTRTSSGTERPIIVTTRATKTT